MQSRSKKMIPSKGINGIEDRLSEMPDQVIVHILSFMPTLDAVKTMLLRRFGNLWTLVPTLMFDFEEYDRLIWTNDEEITIHATFSCFARFVRNVLMFHRRSTIDTFHLYISPFEDSFNDPKIIDDVRMWLRFAIDKEVKDLSFVFDNHDDLTPPRCIFTCQSLATLNLSGCMLEHQPQMHMGSVRKLSLSHVKGSNQAFYQLISGCPSLQDLDIDSVEGLHILNVTSASVSKLCLNIHDVVDHPFTLNCPGVKILDIGVSQSSPSFVVDVIDVSSLQVVNVNDLPYKCSSGLVNAIVRQFRNAEVFTFTTYPFEQLSRIKKMDFPQTRWKRLVLPPRWNRKRCLQAIFELVKSSVKLEELIIDNEYSLDICELLYPEISTCVMPPLKNVTIHGYGKYCEGLLQLVELLLRNAIVLEKMVIIRGKNQLTAVEELNFVKQVSSFRRASANATLIFA